jgi:hypothetical protein
VVIIQQHLIIVMDGHRHFARSLASVGAGAHATWTAGYICLGDQCTRDLSPFSRTSMPISSRVGSSLSSLIYAAWPENMGAQTGGGVMKLVEDGSELSFPSRVLNASEANSDPCPCSSRVVSPSPVNFHTGWTRD